MEHNPHIPPRVLKRILTDPKWLVGTFWSFEQRHEVQILKVLSVSDNGNTKVSTVSTKMHSGSFYLGEILGRLSDWAYEGRDISWAGPGSFVQDIRRDTIFKVKDWGKYHELLRRTATGYTYRQHSLDGGYRGFSPSDTTGRIRGKIRPVTRAFLSEHTPYLESSMTARAIEDYLAP